MTRDFGNLPDGVYDIDAPRPRPKHVRVRVDFHGTGTLTLLNLRDNGTPEQTVERMNKAHVAELLDALKITDIDFVEQVDEQESMDTD